MTRINTVNISFSIKHVISIERMIHLTPLPLMPNYFIGIGSIRGSVIPIIDMTMVLFNHPADVKDSTRLILVEEKELLIGLMVDEAYEILSINQEEVQPIHEMSNTHIFDGVYRNKEKLVSLINLSELFNGFLNLEEIRQQVASQK